MNKLLIAALTLLSSGQIIAQTHTLNWAGSNTGNANEDFARAVVSDDDGFVYTVGAFTGSVDFDPGPGDAILTSNGSTDIFIQKLDVDGNFVWAHSIGASSTDEASSVALDGTGNLYITGVYRFTADFDPGVGQIGLSSAGGRDIFILKLDINGNFVWARSVGSGGDDYGTSIAVDASGSPIVTGNFISTGDFDPGVGTVNIASNGSEDAFILKLNAAGDYVWARALGGASSDFGLSVATDNTGAVYATGTFTGMIDADPNAGVTSFTADGGTDVYMLKLNASGGTVWVKEIGGTSTDRVNGIATDSDANVVLTGLFEGTVDFDPNAGTQIVSALGTSEAFVLKCDSSGNFSWVAYTTGEPGTIAEAQQAAFDATNNIFVTGSFNSGSVDFDAGSGTLELTASGSGDFVFVEKMDPNGEILWAKQIGNATNDCVASGIHYNSNEHINISGFFKNISGSALVDFDPDSPTENLTATSTYDAFTFNMQPCTPDNLSDVIVACDSVVWIDGNTYYASNNTASVSLLNSAGCDSIITLDLTINYASAGIDVVTMCDSFTWINGTTYSSSNNSATHILTNANGCDSVVTLDLTINSSSTGTDVISACGPYMWIDGTVYTSDNNTATHTITNMAGCDSVVTLDLAINTVDVTVTDASPTLTANATGASYQWIDCDNSNTAIVGETNQAFTASSNGNYAVIVDDGNCTDTSVCITVSNVGISELDGELVKVFPNPTAGVVSIEAPSGVRALSILDLKSRLIASIQLTETNAVQLVNIEHLDPGVYFFRFEGEGIQQNIQVILK